MPDHWAGIARHEVRRLRQRLQRSHEGHRLLVRSNLHRRHLTTSQRAAVAAELANLENGQKASATANAVAQKDAAKRLNVSTDSLQRAKKVKEQDPEAFEKIKAGEQTVGGANWPHLRDA